jgi:hypothetical protein
MVRIRSKTLQQYLRITLTAAAEVHIGRSTDYIS